MREILFRGKTKTGEWIEGSLDQSQQTGRGEILIRTHDMELYWNSKMVIPETIGQFTGLTDKNGVKIFEGDFLKMSENYNLARFEQLKVMECVEYSESFACYISYAEKEDHSFLMADEWCNCIVCGNIHDNKNLLEQNND